MPAQRQRIALALMAAAVLGCYMDEPTNPVDSTLFAVVLQPDNLNIPVGGTHTVDVRAFNGRLSPLSSFGAPTFTSTDTLRVRVSPAGEVTGVATGNARVIARVTVNGVTKADTIAVRVSAAGATALGSLTLSPAPIALGGNCQRALAPVIQDAGGTTITPSSSGLTAPFYLSRNPSVATVSSAGTLTGANPGTAYIVGTLTSGGVTKTDSVLVTVGEAPAATVTLSEAGATPSDVRIPAGCLVSFRNAGTKATDVTFVSSAPTNTGGTAPTRPSNISSLAVGATQAVRFNFATSGGAPVTGTVTFRSNAFSTASTTVGGTVTTTAP